MPTAFQAAWRGAGLASATGPGRAHGADGVPLACFFDLVAWRPWLQDARCLLDDAEHARVVRKHRTGDRDDLALAYALHRLVLGRILAQDPVSIALRRDGSGRPCLPGDAWHTSLSHAEGAAAVAVSGCGPIGIDLEASSRAAEMPDIADRVGHPEELEALSGLHPDERAVALLALWVRKEAVLKAAGIGLAREMDTFAVRSGGPVALPLADGGSSRVVVSVRMLDAGPRWLSALASTEGRAPEVAWLHPPET